MEEKNITTELEPKSSISRFVMPLLSLLLFLATLPFISFNPQEVDFIAGGLSGIVHRNIFGKLGTHITWFLLLTHGIAIYPMILMVLASSWRRMFNRGGARPISWEYIISFPVMTLGLSMLIGIWPNFLSSFCTALNLHTIPGGTIGQRLTSPAGCLTLFMNTAGSVVLSAIVIAIPAVIIWNADWKVPFGKMLEKIRSKREAAEDEEDEEEAESLDEQEEDVPKPPAFTPIYQEEATQVPVSAPTPPARQQPSPAPVPPRQNTAQPQGAIEYKLPGLDLLNASNDTPMGSNAKQIERNSVTLQEQFNNFDVDAQVIGVVSGPQVTQYKVQPAAGVRLSKITSLEGNLKMALAAETIRIEAPIPGENCVGIELPNAIQAVVSVHTLMQDKAWTNAKEQIPLLLGKNISGKTVILDLGKAPHLLIAGTTGSGKSVCMNLLIMSMLYRFKPEELRLILVDPKQVEFSVYAPLPHLVVPVITDVNQVALALNWTINEMERRYSLLRIAGVRDIASFNKRQIPDMPQYDEAGNLLPEKLPFLVVIIDELADIMLVARSEVENALSRIAAKSRAVGIHTIIATQRPDVKVITGTIKANYPVRIAFKVAQQVDSQTILGCKGAESLLGRGDMLFMPPGANGLQRIQCGMASDEDRNKVVDFLAPQAPQNFDETVFRSPDEMNGNEVPDDNIEAFERGSGAPAPRRSEATGEEALIEQAIDIILRDRRPTVSYLQRQMGIGFNKASTIMEILEKRGIVGPQRGTAQRDILVTARPGEEEETP